MVASIAKSLPPLLIFSLVFLWGCDRLRRGEVNSARQVHYQGDCGRADISVTRFSNSSIVLAFVNKGTDPLTVNPEKFTASAPDFSQDRLTVWTAGKAYPGRNSFMAPPDSSFSFYFYTTHKRLDVFGEGMLEGSDKVCDLDTISIVFP